jgi:hypothetical protein
VIKYFLTSIAGLVMTCLSCKPHLSSAIVGALDVEVQWMVYQPELEVQLSKAQRSKANRNVEELARQVRREWRIYPSETLNQMFDTKTRVLGAIIKAKGRNDYKATTH